MLQNDAANAGGNGGALGGGGGFPDFSHNAAADSLHRSLAGGSKQDMGGSGSGEGRGGSSGSHGGDGGETLYLKSADDGN